MSNFNMNTVIRNIDGSAIIETDELATREMRKTNPQASEVTRDLTLGAICINALLMNTEHNANLDGETKLKYFNLAKAIHGTMTSGDGYLDLSLKELSMLQSLIESNFTIVVVGQVVDLFNNPAQHPIN